MVEGTLCKTRVLFSFLFWGRRFFKQTEGGKTVVRLYGHVWRIALEVVKLAGLNHSYYHTHMLKKNTAPSTRWLA